MTKSLSLLAIGMLFILLTLPFSGIGQAPCSNWLYLPPGGNASVQDDQWGKLFFRHSGRSGPAI